MSCYTTVAKTVICISHEIIFNTKYIQMEEKTLEIITAPK